MHFIYKSDSTIEVYIELSIKNESSVAIFSLYPSNLGANIFIFSQIFSNLIAATRLLFITKLQLFT